MSITNPANRKTDQEKTIDFSKFIPLVTGGLIVLGITKLLFYYKLFNINVLSFLEFGEIITSFLDTVIALIACLSITSFLFIKIFNESKRVSEIEKDLQKNIEIIAEIKSKDEEFEIKDKRIEAFIQENLKPLEIHTEQSYKSLRGLFYVSLVIFVLIYAALFISYYPNWQTPLRIMFFGVFTMLCTFIFIKFYKKQNSILIRNILLVTILFMIAELLTIYTSITDYVSVKHNKCNQGTRIYFNNETFLKDSTHIHNSDSSTFYIGKTNNYIFVYSTKENTTSVYPMSSVIKIEIKSQDGFSWFKKLIDD